MQRIDLQKVIEIARGAGQKIMEIYDLNYEVKEKGDASPLTAADIAAHRWIDEKLRECFPSLPILSEEGNHIEYSERKDWSVFWLVDPLDGTKEFIKRNGEFTVNIALIENGFPRLGVIYAPALDALYYAELGKGAFRCLANGAIEALSVKEKNLEPYVVVQSRSHPSQEGAAYLEDLRLLHEEIEPISKGSSLKFCLVAEGEADSYPRFVPTMEWDTAAGQAIVEAAGGKVLSLDGQRLGYNKGSLVNPSFIATAHN